MQQIIKEIKNNIEKTGDNLQESYINVENIIKEKINKSEIEIKPKWHFVLKGILALLSITFLFLLAIFFFSFVIFKNRMLPPQGMREIIFNLEILPWVLLSILFFIFATIFLLHTKYSFTYKKPAYIIVGVLFTLILLTGFILDNLKLHDKVKGRIDRRPIPGMREMYKNNKIEIRQEFREGVKQGLR